MLLVLFAACHGGEAEVAVERAPISTESTGSAEQRATPRQATSNASPPSSVTVPPTTTSTPVPPGEAWTLAAYEGFGAWLDVYDWSSTYSSTGVPAAGPEAVDHMADEGVETLFIQASKWDSPTDVLEADRLRAFIDRAEARGIAVIAWYLPTLEDPAADLRRLLAIAALDIDGLAVDIEATNVRDIAERNRRLIDLSNQLRAALPGKVLGGIVLEPVLMEDVNPNYWPAFPWADLAPSYDVWLPMSYWTNRVGGWRAADTYTATNIARIRERIGDPEAPVHTIGGIGDKTTLDDLRGMVVAAAEHAVIGGSIYDYRTSRPEFWAVLRAFRSS